METTSNIQKKIGRVEIDVQELRKLPEKYLKLLFENFYPLNIEHQHDLNRYTSIYTGLNEMFDEVEPGTVIPFYYLEIDLDREVLVFEKVKQ